MAPRKVNMLTAMGFSEQQAKDSLEASGGDVESAVSWAGEVVVGTLGWFTEKNSGRACVFLKQTMDVSRKISLSRSSEFTVADI